MTTNFQTLLKKHASDPALSDNADYLFGHVDCFLSAAAKAMMADGLSRESVMAMFISHAFEIMRFKTPVPQWKHTDDLILKTVLRRVSEDDTSNAA